VLGRELAVPMIAYYLWCDRHGFRYGRGALHLAQALAIACFAFVVYASPFWRQQPMFAAAVFMLLLAIPLYVERADRQAARGAPRGGGRQRRQDTLPGGASHDLRAADAGAVDVRLVLEERHA